MTVNFQQMTEHLSLALQHKPLKLYAPSRAFLHSNIIGWLKYVCWKVAKDHLAAAVFPVAPDVNENSRGIFKMQNRSLIKAQCK